MSILAKILTKKDAADSISPEARLNDDISEAVGKALARGVSLHMVISLLERQENSARHRMAAGIQWSSKTISANLPD